MTIPIGGRGSIRVIYTIGLKIGIDIRAQKKIFKIEIAKK